MNKKFSTLMASALLATSVGAFAQGLNVSRVTDEIKSDKYYVIDVPDGTGTDKLVGVAQDPTTGVFQFKVIDENDLTTLSRVDSVLWKVTPTTVEGGFVRFVLTNKATDLVLSFDKKNAVIGNATGATDASRTIGGNMYQWKWYDSRFSTDFTTGQPLTIDFDNGDSTMVVKITNDIELKDRLVAINRVTKVTKGGRTFSFSAIVVVGNEDGIIGWGLGKASEVTAAIAKGVESAKKNLTRVPVLKGTVPHEQSAKFGGAEVFIRPASTGTGVVAGGAMRAVLESAGITDVLAKSKGSSNPHNLVKATILALSEMRDARMVAQNRGISLERVFRG